MKSDRIIIEAGRTEKNYWRDLWHFRELFYILSWRDIKVRYKQTVIGAAWSIVRPLLTTIIFTIVFSRVAKLGSPPGVPYAILVFCGMLPWQFFANAMSEASNSLIGNSNLVSKIYFPRMIIPASSIITSLVDFGISFLLLVGMMVLYQYVPDVKIIFLPLFVLLVFFAAFGVGLYLTALNVKYRDFRYIIPFIVQFGMYVTPVGFSSEVIPSKWRLLYSINPMVGVVDGFRWCILGQPLYLPGFIVSFAVISVFLFLGINYFRKTEKSFADNI
ncbi:MAG: O-antigen export system, permease protein [Cytophagales bacterium]|jgi:lipopolysaccharide transport system permease protein|nr:ABC transporter permease [Bacteroidota bacterium]WHZ08873.1 MAG: O-antigen export system, permease protein [Cytophagales bacterium]